MIDRAIALLGIAAAVILGVTAMPNKYSKWKPAGYVVGVVVLITAGFAWLWPDTLLSPTTTNSPITTTTGNNNCSVTGSGNQVNCQPPPVVAAQTPSGPTLEATNHSTIDAEKVEI